MNYSIITPTRDRPECMQLLARFIAKQTVKPISWIIVDDGDKALNMPLTPYLNYVRRFKEPNEPVHTIALNMIEGLKYVRSDAVLIFEDDDWYREDYAEKMLAQLEKYEIVGNRPTIHYSIGKRQYKELPKREKACWCKTGFRYDLVNEIDRIIKQDINEYLLDIRVWEQIKKKHSYGFLDTEDPIHIGFKGMVGFKSMFRMHLDAVRENKTFKKDFNYYQLKRWIGNDFNIYSDFVMVN